MGVPVEEDKQLIAQVAHLMGNVKGVGFTYFLDERQQAVVEATLHSAGCKNYLFYGGVESAQRKMLGIFAQGISPSASSFPLVAVSMHFPKMYALTHRDFLGALMALRIKREMIGDTLVTAGCGVCFVAAHLKTLLLQEFTKVGRVGVKIEEGIAVEVDTAPKYEEGFGTVASPRLDAVVALLTGLSRGRAAELITREYVKLGGLIEENTSKTVQENTVVSIRGYGKFIIESTAGLSKKGRLKIHYKKCIS